MIFFKFGEFKNIDDLDRYIRGLRVQDGIMNLRQKLRVLVIDDQDFAPLKILLNHNFNITTYKDIPSFDLLTDFQIVMVDLQGVGQHLNPILQGAHVIREIRKHYPDKYIVAYTGGAAQELLAPSIALADRFTQKDTRIEEWIEMLDDVIRDLANPAYVWKRLRPRLLESGLAPIDLAFLEDRYVRCFDSSTTNYEMEMETLIGSNRLNADAQNIVRSAIGSGIVELFKVMVAG